MMKHIFRLMRATLIPFYHSDPETPEWEPAEDHTWPLIPTFELCPEMEISFDIIHIQKCTGLQ